MLPQLLPPSAPSLPLHVTGWLLKCPKCKRPSSQNFSSLFLQVQNDMYQLRPMNCPFHINIYKHGQYSYRDLPLRYAELGTVYRYERSGTMHGLFRVRGFTQVSAVLMWCHHWLQAESRALVVSS